ncbi:hypothetical protein [Shouchella clausii]|uniref:hypothetical protein n=1 Tax=Shouchella clausii TaxID=79880 RepID=UPI001C72CE59|nr:hypothetical protein [Shouchella clausii]MBX0320249.1 hypothetical protein [Shouchella clausii]
MKILNFEVNTSDFDHAVEVCEAAFGYKGEAWELVKKTRDMHELADFLVEDGVTTNILDLHENE